MTTSSATTLFDAQPDTQTAHTSTHINPLLWFDDGAGYRVVFCRHEVLYRVALNDAHHLALLAVTLRLSELATQTELAAAFGHSVATQRRWETRYHQHGSDGLQNKKPTGRPAALDRGQRTFVRRWFADGVSNREMAKRLAVSETTIRRLLRQLGLQRPTPPVALLPLDDEDSPLPPGVPPETAPAADAAVVAEVVPATTPAPAVPTAAVSGFTLDHDPADRSGDRALARLGVLDDAVPLFDNHEQLPRAGVLLAIPVLQAHGGLDVFAQLYRSLGPAFYGLRTTVVSLVLLALLRIKRPENVKEYSPEQLGHLLGLDRVAEVKTLRRKLGELADRGLGRELMKELARLRLAQDQERLAFLYLDGHVREYSGQEALAKTKKAQRSVATCAATDTWLHDANGEPLLVVTSELNAGLSKMLEPILIEVTALVPAGQRLTVLFDRGGWSLSLFARLLARGVDFITYRKGKTRVLPRSQFKAHVVTENGQEKTYWLHDQPRVRVGRLRPHRRRRGNAGPEFLWLRQVTVLREDGRQTVIVTTRTDLSAVAVVRGLFRRWRQENYFKYMAEEYALDALVEYGVEDVSPEASRPNPERKRVAKERQAARAEVTRLRAELGAAAAANEERRRPTMRGFKVSQALLRGELEQAEARAAALQAELRQLPPRIPATGLKTLTKEKKLVVDAIKIMAYQLETELLKRLGKHYARTEDEGRTLLHAAFQSSARLEVTETELKLTLTAQSSPHRSTALAGLCAELEREGFCYPGSRLQIRLAVDGQEPLTP